MQTITIKEVTKAVLTARDVLFNKLGFMGIICKFTGHERRPSAARKIEKLAALTAISQLITGLFFTNLTLLIKFIDQI